MLQRAYMGRGRVAGGGAAVEGVDAGGEEAVLVHGPVCAHGAAAASAAEDERPLGADRALATRRGDELLLPGRPPYAGAGRPGRAAALPPAPRRRAVEEKALPVSVAACCGPGRHGELGSMPMRIAGTRRGDQARESDGSGVM
jgi:hypothetical protein